MATKNVQESQQQGQGITIGTQGNDDQPTPLGDDLNDPQRGGQPGQHIPNQENSSATSRQRAEGGRSQDE